jgi:hypothetical protein
MSDIRKSVHKEIRKHMKDIKINGEETTESTVHIDGATIEIGFNNQNIQIYGENNEITVVSNDSNLHIYGDHNAIKILGNACNLHIYGDHLSVYVEYSSSNLHIYGTHNNVVMKKGRAVVYGYYGNLTTYREAKVEVHGPHKRANHLEK